MATITGTLLKGAYKGLKNPIGRAAFGGIAGGFYGASQTNRPEDWASYALAGAAIGGFGEMGLRAAGSWSTAKGIYNVGKFAGKTAGKVAIGNPLKNFGKGKGIIEGIGKSGIVGSALTGTAKFMATHPTTMLVGGSAAFIGSSFMGGSEGMGPTRAGNVGMAYRDAGLDGLVQGMHAGRHGGR